MEIPRTVDTDIYDAVNSAISFGVSAEDFMRVAAEHWHAALNEKRQQDARGRSALPLPTSSAHTNRLE